MRILLVCLLFIVHGIVHSQPMRYQVIVDEIMADPGPPVLAVNGLPEAEYVELRNISAITIDLFGWKLGDQTSTATISVHFLLKPDSFLIVCPNTYAQAFSIFGNAIGVSNFPSLDNGHDLIILRSREGNTIAAVEYDSEWFANPIKAQGGWSLEMIDAANYCAGTGNWTASTDRKGGTPGRINAVAALNHDKEPPKLLKSYATDSLHLVCIFDEAVDSVAASRPGNYQLSKPGTLVLSVALLEPFFNRIRLSISPGLRTGEIIELTVRNLRDCSGNAMPGTSSVRSGLAAYPDTPRLVINEILFNPVSPGVDYIELLNYGNSIIDLKDILLANRSAAGIIGSIKTIAEESRLLFPGEFCVLTESVQMVSQQFILKDNNTGIQLPSFPSYPDEKGTAVITNTRGRIIDELVYDEKWHFKLISNREGISLERISPDKPTPDASNWHSASGTAGYGTPGYQNSQSGISEVSDGVVTLQPRVFSPDNDGSDDYLTLNYQFPEPGFVCNVTIYDLSGRIIKQLARNLLCGLKGYLRWDGLDQMNRKAATGIYLVVTDVFSLKGKTSRYKRTVVIAA